MGRPSALEGVVVAERGGRLAAAIATGMLGALGARVTRLEDTAGRPRSDPESWHQHPVALAGKVRIAPDVNATATWQALAATAHVAFTSAPDHSVAPLTVRLSAFGADHVMSDAPEVAVQAASGAMATTGPAGGAPCVVAAPLFEALAGLNAATSVLAALRAGTRDCTLDLAVLDSALALAGTFLPQALADRGRRFRHGARHPLCAPWNAYPARDGWLAICVASDDQWPRLARTIGREALAADPTLATSPQRLTQSDAIDAAVAAWTRGLAVDQAIAQLHAAAIPAGAVRAAGPAVAARLHTVATAQGGYEVPATLLALERTPLLVAGTIDAARPPPVAGRLAAPYPARTGCAPLAGVRVVEIGPYTAGPLTGRYLADLGAEVIKVEPLGGENSRGWSPRHADISCYFANYNCGKRSVEIDLSNAYGAAQLRELVADADILVQNLKPGALARLGIDLEALCRAHPRLIACSISGYGTRGSQVPALDTVVQAGSGLMALVCTPPGTGPVKTGYSFGDLTAAHVATFGVLAALLVRDRDGQGQAIDVSMHDALVWLTQLGWSGAVPACTVVRDGEQYRLEMEGEAPFPILEVADAMQSEAACRRDALRFVAATADHAWPVLASPLRWRAAAAAVGPSVPATGADNVRFRL